MLKKSCYFLILIFHLCLSQESPTNETVIAECKIYNDPHRMYLQAKYKLLGWTRNLDLVKDPPNGYTSDGLIST